MALPRREGCDGGTEMETHRRFAQRGRSGSGDVEEDAGKVRARYRGEACLAHWSLYKPGSPEPRNRRLDRVAGRLNNRSEELDGVVL